MLVGSNGFNLAAMIGLSAVLAGSVKLPREVLVLEGTVGLVITVLAGALLLHWLSPAAAAGLSAVVLLPYLTLVIAGARLIERRAHRPRSPTARLARALHEHPGPERPPDTSNNPTHHLLALIVVDLVLIVAGSAGMVRDRADARARLAHLERGARHTDPGTAHEHPQRRDGGPPRPGRPRRGAGRRDVQQQHDQPRRPA